MFPLLPYKLSNISDYYYVSTIECFSITQKFLNKFREKDPKTLNFHFFCLNIWDRAKHYSKTPLPHYYLQA